MSHMAHRTNYLFKNNSNSIFLENIFFLFFRKEKYFVQVIRNRTLHVISMVGSRRRVSSDTM